MGKIAASSQGDEGHKKVWDFIWDRERGVGSVCHIHILERRECDYVGVCIQIPSFHTELWHTNSCGDIRVEMIPYSRSPSATSYNSLYLPLLNLEEKMDSEKSLYFFTDTWKEKETWCTTWSQADDARMTRKKKEGEKRGGEKRGRGGWTEDLLRVFAPWAEGTAGPDLAVCRLVGSILTLKGGRAVKRSKVKGHRKVRETLAHSSTIVRRRVKGGNRDQSALPTTETRDFLPYT